MTSTIQAQLDARAIEIAKEAQVNSERNWSAIESHIKSCTRWQVTQLVGVITILLGTVATLISLYVLPPRHVETTTTTTLITPERK